VVNTDYQFNEQEKQFIKTDIEHHLNWRIYEEFSGGLCTELLTHSVDVANWSAGCLPKKSLRVGRHRLLARRPHDRGQHLRHL
jgi:predicted dehydrogenase